MKLLIDKDKIEQRIAELEKKLEYAKEKLEKLEDSFDGELIDSLESDKSAYEASIDELQSILQQSEEINEKYLNLPKDYKKITGWNNPDEQDAYDLGRKHENIVTIEFLKNWKGNTNSHFGQLMKDKCEEYNENEAIEFAEWMNDIINPFVRISDNKWVQTCGNSTSWTIQELFKLYKR